ncbi:MAG: hypothetical protein WCJ93_03590 [Methanomicrobiales archaeon]
MGCTTTPPHIAGNNSALSPNNSILKNSTPAQEISDKVIAHEESYKLYSTNGTVTILRTGTPRSYSFTLYAQRPDHYYLSWADANGNITDIFITTGLDEYIIHSSFNETQHFQKGFEHSTKYDTPRPPPSYDRGYDILELVTSPLREGRDNSTRNLSAEGGDEYSVVFSAGSFDGALRLIIHMTVNRSDYSVKEVAINGPEDNPLMEITFNDIETPSQFPGTRFELPPGSGPVIDHDVTGYTSPLYPIFDSPPAVIYPYRVSTFITTPSTPSTTSVPRI